jgi:hypothetical protein
MFPPLLFREKKSLVAIALVALVTFPLVMIAPFGYDNCVYQSIALDLKNFGRIPYLGSWDHNFPGIIAFHFVAVVLFGNYDIGFRIVDLAIQLCFGVYFYSVLREWLTPRVATYAVILYILYYVAGGVGMYGQRDVYGSMAIVAALVYLWRRPFTSRDAIITGFWLGLCVVVRPTSAALVLLVALYLLFARNASNAQRIRSTVQMGLASMIPMGLVIVYYCTIPGGFTEFINATVHFNLDVYSHYPAEAMKLVREVARTGALIPLAILGGLASSNSLANGVKRWPAKQDRWLYVAFIVVSFVTVVYMRKYFRYQFAPVVVLLCPFAAIGIERLTRAVTMSWLRYSIVGLGMFFSSFIGYNTQTLEAVVHWIEGKSAGGPAAAAYAAEWYLPEYGAPREWALISYLRSQHVTDGDVEICSRYPEVRLHLGVECAGPYVSSTPIAWPMNGRDMVAHRDTEARYTDYQRQWQAAYIQQLIAHKPRFFIVTKEASEYDPRDPSLCFLTRIAGFNALLQSYSLDTTFGGFKVYRRTSG